MTGNFTEHSANERTFLAWIRTAIAVIAFGFVLEKFNLFILALTATASAELAKAIRTDRLSGPIGRYEGLAFMLSGLVLIGLGYWRFARNKKLIDSRRATASRRRAGRGRCLRHPLCARCRLLRFNPRRVTADKKKPRTRNASEAPFQISFRLPAAAAAACSQQGSPTAAPAITRVAPAAARPYPRPRPRPTGQPQPPPQPSHGDASPAAAPAYATANPAQPQPTPRPQPPPSQHHGPSLRQCHGRPSLRRTPPRPAATAHLSNETFAVTATCSWPALSGEIAAAFADDDISWQPHHK